MSEHSAYVLMNREWQDYTPTISSVHLAHRLRQACGRLVVNIRSGDWERLQATYHIVKL